MQEELGKWQALVTSLLIHNGVELLVINRMYWNYINLQSLSVPLWTPCLWAKNKEGGEVAVLTICIQETVARYRVGSPDSRVRKANSYPTSAMSDAPELAQSAGGLDPLRPRAERGTSPQSHNSTAALHNLSGDRIISCPLRRVRSPDLNPPLCLWQSLKDSAIMHNTRTDRANFNHQLRNIGDHGTRTSNSCQ
jgi:hypothetical protein